MNMREKNSANTPKRKREVSATKVTKADFSYPSHSPVGQILHLQQTLGNQGVQGLLKSSTIQAKLTINKPNDIYEQEADRIAEQVMKMDGETVGSQQSAVGKGQGTIQRKPGIPLTNTSSSKEEEEKKRGESFEDQALSKQIMPLVQQKNGGSRPAKTGGCPAEVTPRTESRIQSLHGNGRPLPESVRAYFEPRLGRDFSEVRVHTDTKAVASARAMNARAFTFGNNIVFEDRQYAPETTDGRQLLAHELTHTIQQDARPDSNAVRATKTNSKNAVEQSETGSGEPPIAVKSCEKGKVARQVQDAGVFSITTQRIIIELNRPDPIAGVGAFRAAFVILSGLSNSELEGVLAELKQQDYTELLLANIGAAPASDKARLLALLEKYSPPRPTLEATYPEKMKTLGTKRESNDIRAVIDLFSKSRSSKTDTGRAVLARLKELYKEEEIGLEEMEPGLGGEYRTGIPSWGRFDLALNEQQIFAAMAFKMVHEAVHAIEIERHALDDELAAFTFESEYYMEMKENNLVPEQYFSIAYFLELKENNREIDFLFPLYSKNLDVDWIRTHIDEWGGISNRLSETKAAYVNTLLEEGDTYQEMIFKIVSSPAQGPFEYQNMIRKIGGDNLEEGIRRLKEVLSPGQYEELLRILQRYQIRLPQIPAHKNR